MQTNGNLQEIEQRLVYYKMNPASWLDRHSTNLQDSFYSKLTFVLFLILQVGWTDILPQALGVPFKDLNKEQKATGSALT